MLQLIFLTFGQEVALTYVRFIGKSLLKSKKNTGNAHFIRIYLSPVNPPVADKKCFNHVLVYLSIFWHSFSTKRAKNVGKTVYFYFFTKVKEKVSKSSGYPFFKLLFCFFSNSFISFFPSAYRKRFSQWFAISF